MDDKAEKILEGILVIQDTDVEPEEKMEDKAESLPTLRKWVEAFRSSFADNITYQQRDRDWYNGQKQIPPEQLSELYRRKQPAIVYNHIDLAVNGILGVVKSSPTDPKAFARQPNAEDAADVATKLLRYVADECQFDRTRLEVADTFVVEGVAAVHLGVNEYQTRRGPERCITCEKIEADEFIYDPFSQKLDFSDATYLGIGKWMDVDQAKSRWHERFEEIGIPLNSSALDFNDTLKPANLYWVDEKKRRIMVVELYYRCYDDNRQPVWHHVVFCSTGILEFEECEMVDDKGRKICPIVAQSCIVDRENNRFGLVRAMIDPQSEINARRSRLLYLANANKVQKVEPDAPNVDPTIVSREASKADGVLPPGYQMIPMTDIAQAQALLLNSSVDFINRRAPSPAVLGRVDQAQSGRAKLVDQQQGLTELALYLDRMGNLEERIYRNFWYLAQQYLTLPMLVMITGDGKIQEHITINTPIYERLPVIDPQTGQMVIDPQTGSPVITSQQVGVENSIAMMDMNITVKSTPESPNLQTEVFESVVQLLSSKIPVTSPEFKMLLELAPIQDKARLQDMLKAMEEEAKQAAAAQAEQQAAVMQQQTEMASAAAALQIEKAKSEIAKSISTAQKNSADATKTLTEDEILKMTARQEALPQDMVYNVSTQPVDPYIG